MSRQKCLEPRRTIADKFTPIEPEKLFRSAVLEMNTVHITEFARRPGGARSRDRITLWRGAAEIAVGPLA